MIVNDFIEYIEDLGYRVNRVYADQDSLDASYIILTRDVFYFHISMNTVFKAPTFEHILDYLKKEEKLLLEKWNEGSDYC